LTECTFSPEIASKKTSSLYLKNRSHSKNINKKEDKKIDTSVSKVSPMKHKDINSSDFEEAKRIICNRLYTINQ